MANAFCIFLKYFIELKIFRVADNRGNLSKILPDLRLSQLVKFSSILYFFFCVCPSIGVALRHLAFMCLPFLCLLLLLLCLCVFVSSVESEIPFQAVIS